MSSLTSTDQALLGASCACIAFDAVDDPSGEWSAWRPCPTALCERPDHRHEDEEVTQ